MTDDVKDLLSRALGQEPPLRIDRDEVIQQGRKRLRRRRMFEAGGVVAAVVVVAVGAATLTSLAGSEPDRMPPAASRTQSAPPGPALPLPTTPIETSGSTPPIPSVGQSVTSPALLGPQQLTELLYNTDVVSRNEVRSLAGTPEGLPAFQNESAQYVYKADVNRSNDAGSLEVTVDLTKKGVTDCVDVPATFGDCEIRGTPAMPVAVSQWRGPDGERRVFAFTVMSDGTRVAAIASNISSLDRKLGKTPPDTPPVLTADELISLVVKVAGGAS